MNFKMFEETAIAQTVHVGEPQGMLRKSAAVKIWSKIGVGKAGDGFGVYAIDDIADNETIEECPVIEMARDEFNSKVLMDYMFKISQDRYVLALGSGCVYNHRNEPNARWEYLADQKILKVVSTRSIRMGEEIYISYGRDYFKTREQNMKA